MLVLCCFLGAPVCAAEGGAVTLTEAMINPVGPDDEEREWIEIYNDSSSPVSVGDLVIRVVHERDARELHIFDGGGDTIPAGGFLVAGAALHVQGAHAVISRLRDGRGFESTLLLPNDSGAIELLLGDEVVDQLVFGTEDLPIPVGASLNREPAGGEPNWCAGRFVWDDDEPDLGTPGFSNTWCDDDNDGFAEDQGDCDDQKASVNPVATEVCDGVDQDCDGMTDDPEELVPFVGCMAAGICAGTVPSCEGQAGWACLYDALYETDEVSCDGLDNDCDGQTDAGLLNRCGMCGAPLADVCDGRDNDCDGETDEDALSGPSRSIMCLTEGVCAGAVARCAGSEGWVCAYDDAFEGPDESGCDDLDNDCDGETDETFGVGAPCVAGHGTCSVDGVFVCSLDGVGVRCDAVPTSPTDERCGDGQDNDCDGDTDEGFSLGEDCVVGVGGCRALGKMVCSTDGLSSACSASPGLPKNEWCDDQVDNDCDGQTDEPGCMVSDQPQAELPVSCDVGSGGGGRGLALLLLLVTIYVICPFSRLRTESVPRCRGFQRRDGARRGPPLKGSSRVARAVNLLRYSGIQPPRQNQKSEGGQRRTESPASQ